MFTSTFMRTETRGLSIESVALGYAEWALGSADDKKRTFRLQEGVLPQWTSADVLRSEPLVGAHGSRIDMRLAQDEMLFRFVHRDTTDGAVFWHSVARARRLADTLVVEHAVARDAPRDYELEPIASPSRVVLDLVERDGIDITPRDLLLPPVRLQRDEVPRFVEHVLLRPDRTLPIVVIAPDRFDGPPLIDHVRLGRSLRGISAVALLETEESTFAFSDALAERGLGREFRCYHGGVHSYGVTANLERDHRLWLGDSLRRIDSRRRASIVAGLLARRGAVRDTPPGFFSLIEGHDREEKRNLARRLSERRQTPAPGTGSIPQSFINQIEEERRELQSALSKALSAEQENLSAFMKSDDDRRQAEQAREDAEARLEQERLISADLREQVQAAKVGKRFAPGGDAVAAFRTFLEGKPTPLHCLLLLQAAFEDRIVLLDSALSSAAKSSEFRHCDKLKGLLGTLASEYWHTLANGKGDTEAAKAFTPNTFAANESETTRSNRRAVEERTFMYGGRSFTMWRHLKIGVAETTAETIRVHFEWIATERKIVIGWCGEHRFRVD